MFGCNSIKEVYFGTATNRRLPGASWSIIAPPFIGFVFGNRILSNRRQPPPTNLQLISGLLHIASLYRFGRSSQAAKWTLVSIAEPHARMVSRRVPSVIDRQQQSGLLVRNRVDTKSLFRTITKNHIASSAFRGIDSVLNGQPDTCSVLKLVSFNVLVMIKLTQATQVARSRKSIFE